MKDKKRKINWRNYIFLIIRMLLILSISINILMIISVAFNDVNVFETELNEELSMRLELIFWAAITLILSFITDYFEHRENMDIPDMLEIVIVLFIYAGIFLSFRYGLYDRFYWWDDLLHTLSGVIIGFIGFIIIYKINYNYSLNFNPLLVAIFSFSFAVMLGVMWEIVEFASDAILATNNQRWDMPNHDFLIGSSYQGSGLRDTMSDLIVDSIGALITSIITYFLFKNEKQKTLKRLERMIHKDNEDDVSQPIIETGKE